jgi:hypothetical protein
MGSRSIGRWDRKNCIRGGVTEGPSDRYIAATNVGGVFTSYSDKKTRDFLYNPDTYRFAFDQVHTFTVINQVRDMYVRTLNRLGDQGGRLSGWQWGKEPIIYKPHAGVDANAYYSREEKVLAFFYFSASRSKTVYTCESLDVVAHETGHAILDTLKPGFFDSWHPQTGAVHEAFGDLTAIFLVISLPTLRHKLLLDTRGNIDQESFLSRLAEQFGKAVLPTQDYLRTANNRLKLGETSDEVHDLSVILTGAIYEILIKITNYELDKNRSKQEPEVTLLLASQKVQELLLKALLAAPEKNIIFADIASHMIKFCDLEHRGIIKTAFESRKIPLIFDSAELDKAASLNASSMMSKSNMNHKTCCGTLLHGGAGELMIRAADVERGKGVLSDEPELSTQPAVTSMYEIKPKKTVRKERFEGAHSFVSASDFRPVFKH